MAKIQITQPFNAWHGGSHNDYVIRESYGFLVSVRLSRNTVYSRTEDGILYTGATVADAIAWADQYILDNYEVEKPLDERLKDAESEIVTLKGRVKELEGAGFKFAIGQIVRIKIAPSVTLPVAKRVKIDGGINIYYRLDTKTGKPYSTGYREDELEAV